jgi:hypothetical protein
LFCFLALTVLANGQTNFYIQSIQENADGAITVTWPAVPTWTYHVMYADSPGGAWQDLSDDQLTAGTNVWTLCYTDTNSAAASQRFYKIRTTRPKLIMALVLDRSGSMNPVTGTSMGGAYLPGAVSTFISNFDDNYDEAAMVSFATTATVGTHGAAIQTGYFGGGHQFELVRRHFRTGRPYQCAGSDQQRNCPTGPESSESGGILHRWSGEHDSGHAELPHVNNLEFRWLQHGLLGRFLEPGYYYKIVFGPGQCLR